MRELRIAMASTMSLPGEVAANLMQITEFARRAGQDGAHLLLTPELSATGYGPYPAVLETAEPAGDGPIYARLAALAAETNVTLCAGFVEMADARRYLAHYIIAPSGQYQVQRKHRVTLAECPLTPGVALSGHPEGAPDPADPGQPDELRFTIFEVHGVRCAIAICADIGITEVFPRTHALGVDVLMNPAGGGGRREQRVTTEELRTPQGRTIYLDWLEKTFFPGAWIVGACLEFGMCYTGVNMCGYDGLTQYHMGHGMIVTPQGEVPGFFHGLPNLDRQRPMYTQALVEFTA